MKGKELLLNLFQNGIAERTPWVPYTGVHVGRLLNIPADKLLMEKDVLIQALLESVKAYSPDGLPVIFDLQIEAEILGCDIIWNKDNPPSVVSHPFENTENIPEISFTKESGRLPIILAVMEELKNKIGDEIALYGLICGPLTLASHLRGINIFMDMFENPEYVTKLLEYCTVIAKKMLEYYSSAGMDILAIVDPIVSQIAPDSFEQFLVKPYSDLFSYIRQLGKHSSFFVCGDATASLDLMCKTKPDCISVDENVDIIEASKVTEQYDIIISGNIPLTTLMLLGSQKDNQKFAVDLIENMGNSKFILAPGCDMPYATPPENIIGISQVVQNLSAAKHYLRNYEINSFEREFNLPDYSKQKFVSVDVFTIDSGTCAACGYMYNSAQAMEKPFGKKICVIERKISDHENIAYMKKLGIRNLPTIVIDGNVKFVSKIPNYDELYSEISDVIGKRGL